MRDYAKVCEVDSAIVVVIQIRKDSISMRKTINKTIGTKIGKYLATALLAGVCSVANAEVSGVFAGLQVGYGDLVYKVQTRTNGLAQYPSDKNVSDMQYGGILGYKHFFSDKFGFRLGGYFTYTNLRFVDDMQQKQDISVMAYGGSFDVLLNAVSKPSVDAGFYAGFYIGGKTYDSARINELEEQWRLNATRQGTQTIAKTHLDVGANLGMRIHYLKYNGIEVGVSLPFFEHILYQRSQETLGMVVSYRHSTTSNYAVYFRYTLSINTSKGSSSQSTPASTKTASKGGAKSTAKPSTQNRSQANTRGGSNARGASNARGGTPTRSGNNARSGNPRTTSAYRR